MNYFVTLQTKWYIYYYQKQTEITNNKRQINYATDY